MTGRRRVCLIHPGEPLREGFDKIGSHTKFPSDIIEVGDVGGETAGRGRAMRDATLDWNAATTDTASVAGRRGCGRASQVTVGGVDGRSDRMLRVSIDKVRETPDLELGESLTVDTCLKKVRKEVRVSKGIVRGFTRKKDLHSSISDVIQKVSQRT